MEIILLSFAFLAILYVTIVTGELSLIILSVLFGIFVLLNICQKISTIRASKGKKSKRDISWGTIIIVYVCLALFVTVTGLLIININDRIHSVPTTGIVSRIEYDDNASEDSQETCTGYAKYTVNGKEYESKYTSSSMVCNKKIGSKVKIYYRKDKPEKITTNSNLLVLIFATLFVGFCTYLVLKKAHKGIKNKK